LHIPRAMQRRAQDIPLNIRLTERETAIMRLMVDGLSAKEIGRDLGISPRTVEGRVRTIILKLGAANKVHAVVIAIRAGIVEG
jgi:LuxR family transcriptional regulator, quorum-sensing system regulator SolR